MTIGFLKKMWNGRTEGIRFLSAHQTPLSIELEVTGIESFLQYTMVADALIYHPAIAHYNKYVATTSVSTLIFYATEYIRD